MTPLAPESVAPNLAVLLDGCGGRERCDGLYISGRVKKDLHKRCEGGEGREREGEMISPPHHSILTHAGA